MPVRLVRGGAWPGARAADRATHLDTPSTWTKRGLSTAYPGVRTGRSGGRRSVEARVRSVPQPAETAVKNLGNNNPNLA